MMKVSPHAEEIRIETRRAATLDVLEARFAGQVPSYVIARIKTETDLAKLVKWNKLAAIAKTPEEFQAGMG